MSVTVKFVDGIPVVEMEGKLTIDHQADEVRRTVRDLLEKGQRRIVFNGGAISYLDSTGLEVLVGSYVRARRVGGEFRLAAFQDRPRQLLDMTHLSTVIPLHPSTEEAIAGFGT